MQTVDLELARRFAVTRLERGIARLRWHAAATRFQLALRRHDRALKLAYKYGYNPAQPRDELGRWSETGGGQGTRLAGDIPAGNLPEIPKNKPPTSVERTAVYKTVARWLKQFGGPIGKFIAGAEWLYEHSPLIEAYNDPPKSLEELQRDVTKPGLGYDIHHVVEQTQAENEGFPRDLIDAPDNKVRIPRMKHWEINAWYQMSNPDYGWETPREYLNGRSWAVRRSVGLRALRIFGVLEP